MKNSKQKNKKVFIQTTATEKITLEGLAERISHIVEHDDIPFFIAILDKMYESWEVTEKLIKHFKGLEIVYNEGFENDEKEDLSPKSLI